MPAWLEATLHPVSRTPYEMFTPTRATCPTCQRPVWLMTPKFIKDSNAAPTFALRFFCRTVEQVGVGPVPKVRA